MWEVSAAWGNNSPNITAAGYGSRRSPGRQSQTKAPPGGDGRGGAVVARSRLRRARALDVQALLDHLNDAAGARLDQHGLAVDHGVAIGRGAIGLRHVVIGDA